MKTLITVIAILVAGTANAVDYYEFPQNGYQSAPTFPGTTHRQELGSSTRYDNDQGWSGYEQDLGGTTRGDFYNNQTGESLTCYTQQIGSSYRTDCN